MSDIPKYVPKNRRLSKTKTVFIFRRNYLDINDFKKTVDGWLFEEEFNHYGNKCYFCMIVHSDNIFSMYEVDCKSAKIKGKKNNFGIFFRTAKQRATFQIKHTSGNVDFILRCDGKGIAYDNGKGIRKTKEEKLMKECSGIHQEGSKVAVAVPSTVSWSVSHPFQGGGVSPR